MSTKRPENSGGRPRSQQQPDPRPPAQADVGEIARAVSTAFLVLVFGALLQPVVSTVLPQSIGQFWLIAVALIAFAFAGVRCGRAGPTPVLYGAGGALGAFLLVVPLQFIQGTFEPLYALYTLIAALVVGGLAGQIGARATS